MNYHQLIHKYIKPDSKLYPIYMIHVTLVTNKALEIARRLELEPEQLQFIEEASMLHDIGIVKVKDEEIYCTGELPYIAHGSQGRKILEQEGYPRHALVAERHTGTGLRVEDIEKGNLPIPKRDMRAKTIEEEIISYADLFYSKDPAKLWHEKSIEEVRQMVAKYGKEHSRVLESWIQKFENLHC